ncbi:MAG: hypothetical protein BGO98_07330 [Myxococcales bacterium 68-20]|nr:RNA polymerase sigma factor [Myxococcales bacterium]OJY26805.1 MAG: hypothetical protein BGO98_07330 [Myxococcales bacterium 68-20]
MTAATSELVGTSKALDNMPGTRTQAMSLRDMAKMYFANVWRFLRTLGVSPHAIDDAAQDVFVVAARRRADIQPGSEKSFLFSVAVHVARETRKKYGREALADDPDDESLEPAELSTPEDSLGRKQERDLLMSLLAGLTDELRAVFVLYEIEGQTMTAIAELLGVPTGTVASRLRRGREQFEARLQRHQLRMRGDK